MVLGVEGPGLSHIPNDAPTLGKDARQLILQKVSADKWKLFNFDISTAFLQGQGDGRALGIHPPEELKHALDMKLGDQCQLMGGAYGRVDAPFLWFKTLKGTLENLGFVQSPFDACTFSLISQDAQGKPEVHGILGVHVDDGPGGGDQYFKMVIQKLRDKYNFGSYDEGEFTFTGIHFRQWDPGSAEPVGTRRNTLGPQPLRHSSPEISIPGEHVWNAYFGAGATGKPTGSDAFRGRRSSPNVVRNLDGF